MIDSDLTGVVCDLRQMIADQALHSLLHHSIREANCISWTYQKIKIRAFTRCQWLTLTHLYLVICMRGINRMTCKFIRINSRERGGRLSFILTRIQNIHSDKSQSYTTTRRQKNEDNPDPSGLFITSINHSIYHSVNRYCF